MTVNMFLYYLINSEKGKFYIGLTNNLERRIKEHNYETKHYTGRIRGKWKLIGYKAFKNKIEAEKEEKRLKRSKNKKYISWYFQVESIVQRIE